MRITIDLALFGCGTDDVTYGFVTSSSRPDLEEEAGAAFRERWPEFIFHDPISRKYSDRVQAYFPEFDIYALHEGRVVAGGWGVPFAFAGDVEALPDGYDGTLVRAIEGHEAGITPTAFAFTAAAVGRDHDRSGLAQHVLAELSQGAGGAGMNRVFAPIRPTWKARYPNVPMARYAGWTRADGLSIDPWIRTHQRMGARIIGPAENSMVIPGTVLEWETWAEMPFPDSGEYVVPDALNLLNVDRKNDYALYCEENLWVEHRSAEPA